MQTEADLLAMLRALGAVEAVIAGECVVAIFDNEYAGIEVGMDVESAQPVLTCRTSDVAGVARGATVEIGAERYRVLRLEPDGTGISRVVLRK